MEQLVTALGQIYNTLCLIETRGENTRHMAACLNAMIDVISAAKEMAEPVEAKEKKVK